MVLEILKLYLFTF